MNPHGRQQQLEEHIFKPVNDILGVQEEGSLHFEPNSKEAALAMERKGIVEFMEGALSRYGFEDSIGSVREILVEIRQHALNAWYGRSSNADKLNAWYGSGGKDFALTMSQFNNFKTVIDQLSSALQEAGLNPSNLNANTVLSEKADNAIKEAFNQLKYYFPSEKYTTASPTKPRIQ